MRSPLPALNERYTRTCFRLETLQDYAGVSSEEQRLVSAWLRGQRQFRSLHDEDGYLRRVAAHALVGKTRSRVHVVEFPLSDYIRYELDAYRENVAVGEEVGIADARAVGPIGPDFWLFDEGTDHAEAVIMNYELETARLLGFEHLTLREAPDQMEELKRRADLARSSACPLDEFVSQLADTQSTPRAS